MIKAHGKEYKHGDSVSFEWEFRNDDKRTLEGMITSFSTRGGVISANVLVSMPTYSGHTESPFMGLLL